jgi:cytochrome c nitrite reductase small subunit
MNKRFGILLTLSLGIFIGVGVYTFRYAEGLSYFSKDPKACVNCHIMQPQFDSWQKASHHTSATCVECHLPHNMIEKYMAKADNGYRHSRGFTLQDFHEPIMISPQNSRILQENCVRCHETMVHDLVGGAERQAKGMRCVHCHTSVGHGERTGMGRFEKHEFVTGENK